LRATDRELSDAGLEHINDEMREPIASQWPDLVRKLTRRMSR